MRRAFIDTAAWIAVVNQKDALHQISIRLLDELESAGAELFTTEFVLIELADALCAPAIREATIGFINSLRESEVNILPAGSPLLEKAWSLYSRRSDKDWGLTDCTSFVVMEEFGLTEAFTSDQHFSQAGFARLM